MLRNSLAKFFKVDSLIENLTGYVETRVELLKLEAKEELAKSLSKILVYAVIAFMCSMLLLFLSMSLAFKIGESLGAFGGFAIVGGFYGLVSAIILIKRKELITKAEHRIRQEINKQKN